MSNRPRYPKTDTVQSAIVHELKSRGFIVMDLSARSSVADIAVYGYDHAARVRMWKLFELKSENGRLSPEQEREVAAGRVFLARDIADVLRAFGVVK